jgi:recombinational DNA repair protein (RecF pathway)
MFLATEAIVISRRHGREADRYYFLFSKEIGLVEVRVRAAGRSSSKLAGHLEPLAIVNVLLCKGKHGWQLNNVVAVNRPLFNQPLAGKVYGAVGTIIKSLVPIESPEIQIYNDLRALLDYLRLQFNNVDQDIVCRSAILRFAWRALALSGHDDVLSTIEGELEKPVFTLLQAARLGEPLAVGQSSLLKAENYTELICAERLESRVQLTY